MNAFAAVAALRLILIVGVVAYWLIAVSFGIVATANEGAAVASSVVEFIPVADKPNHIEVAATVPNLMQLVDRQAAAVGTEIPPDYSARGYFRILGWESADPLSLVYAIDQVFLGEFLFAPEDGNPRPKNVPVSSYSGQMRTLVYDEASPFQLDASSERKTNLLDRQPGWVVEDGRAPHLPNHVSVDLQSLPDEDYANTGNEHRREGCPKHSFCPKSHFLLGAQIAYITVFLPLTLSLVFFGYKLADRGFDAFDSRKKAVGVTRLLSGGLLIFGSALLLPYGGYWLAFEGGLASILR